MLILEDTVVFRSMHEAHHVGILLDGTRLTQVREHRPLAFVALSALDATVQLRECQDGNIQFLGKTFQRTGNRRNLFLTAAKPCAVGIHQLQVVNHDDAYALLANQSASFRAQFEDAHTRRVIHIERRTLQSS